MSEIVQRKIAAGEGPPEKGTPAWHSLVAAIEAEKDRRICAARRTKAEMRGWPCEKAPRVNGKCRFHGGKSVPAGPHHPRHRTGDRSRYGAALRGTPLERAYQKVRNDAGLLALTEEIAVVVGRIEVQTRQIYEGRSERSWVTASRIYAELQDATKRGADGEAQSLLDALGEVIDSGKAEKRAWEEWEKSVLLLRKLVDTERKYRDAMQLNLPVERANALLGTIIEAVRRVVPRELIPEVLEEMNRIRFASRPGDRTGHLRLERPDGVALN